MKQADSTKPGEHQRVHESGAGSIGSSFFSHVDRNCLRTSISERRRIADDIKTSSAWRSASGSMGSQLLDLAGVQPWAYTGKEGAMHLTGERQPARRIPTSIEVAWSAAFGAATAFVVWLGSTATCGAVESTWFEQLEKPAFYPPSATFGIVWTGLYILVAIAGWLAWRSGGDAKTTVPWVVQLILNLGWSWIFFGWQLPGWALVEVIVLMAAAVWFAVVAFPYSRWATYLFIPYILWIGFATVLNAWIVGLN